MVFGLLYVRTTYQKNCKVHKANLDLIPEFTKRGYGTNGTWLKYKSKAMTFESDSEDDAKDNGGDLSVANIYEGRPNISHLPCVPESDLPLKPNQDLDSDDTNTYCTSQFNGDNEETLSNADNASPPQTTAYWINCCAYCDNPLPKQRSTKLRCMQEKLDSQSEFDGINSRDASPNPFHCFICPFTTTVDYCARARNSQLEDVGSWPSSFLQCPAWPYSVVESTH